nr:MAG TPA: hypothetical protein [Bacteriophage sp.]
MQLMGRFRRIKLDQTFQSCSLLRRAFRPPNRRPFNQHQRKYHKWRVQRHATKWRLAG